MRQKSIRLPSVSILCMTALLPILAGCATAPVSQDANAQTPPADFARLGADAVAPEVPIVERRQVALRGRDMEGVPSRTVSPRLDGFDFDAQLAAIAETGDPAARKPLIMSYLMRAWDLGPDGYARAVKRLEGLQITTE